MPPGTGDIQLTLVQKIKLDGVVIVSTPQEIALIDARRAVAMFQKTNTPILGFVENMSYFPTRHRRPHPDLRRGWRQGGGGEDGPAPAGRDPLDQALRQACDDGRPVTAAAPSSPAANVFNQIAKALL
uniref:P-loop NTPase n=1 Tax=Phenylobacterium glaciei TaxID=2803784 RepID=A0A974P5A3_9CAUL|nr:P-loop NTPase [Phenylobacterium glaciei]